MTSVLDFLQSGGMAIWIAVGVVLLIVGLVKKFVKLIVIGAIVAVAALLLTGGIGMLGL